MIQYLRTTRCMHCWLVYRYLFALVGLAGNGLFYFFLFISSYKTSMPLRIVSTLVQELAFETSSSFPNVSLSSLTATCVVFGFSDFGLPVRGLILFSPHFLNTTNSYYTYWDSKSQELFSFFTQPSHAAVKGENCDPNPPLEKNNGAPGGAPLAM